MIKMQIIGHLGDDAGKKEVSGKTVINFNIAHTEKFTSNGQPQSKTIWVSAAYWTDKTGILPYLVKGVQVYVEGTPEVRTWEGNGKQGASLTCRVSKIELLGSAERQPATTHTPNQYQPAYSTDNTQDDLPF